MTKTLSSTDVNNIRKYVSHKLKTQKQLAQEYNVTEQTICLLIRNITHQDVPKDFETDNLYHCRNPVCKRTMKTAQQRYCHESYCIPAKIEQRKKREAKQEIKRDAKSKPSSGCYDEHVTIKKDILTEFEVPVEMVLNEKNLKKHYNKQVLKNHPDKGGQSDMYRRIKTIYDELKNLSEMEKCLLKSDQKMFIDCNIINEKYNENRFIRETQLRTVNEHKNETNFIRANQGTNNEEFKAARRRLYKEEQVYKKLCKLHKPPSRMYLHHLNLVSH